MHDTTRNVTLALGLEDSYEQKAALGVIKFARSREDWRLFAGDWLTPAAPGRPARRTDGIIARITHPSQLERLKAFRVPVVDIAGAFDDPAIMTVHNDDRLTGFMAGRHLLSRGLRNFAFVGICGGAWSDERLAGMTDALAESGEGTLGVKKLEPSWSEKGTYLTRLAKWLRELPAPCGVLAANDMLGYKVVLAAAASDIAIPEQLAVIGVDNAEVFCELARPSLTSIPCDCEKIGAEAAGLLARTLAGEPAQRHSVVSPWPVVTRDSTDVMIGDDRLLREVKKYIRANIDRGINVADVVAAFPLSRRTLEMRFNRSGDRTLHDEILSARLEKACRLLEEGKNATEAGLGSGFASNQHFHHVFKKFMRMTPTAYSNRFRKRDAGKSKRGDASFLPIAPV